MATRTFKTTFINKFSGEQVEIISKITDKMEERNLMKQAYAIDLNHRKFEKDHKRWTEFEGKNILLWTDKTVEIAQ